MRAFVSTAFCVVFAVGLAIAAEAQGPEAITSSLSTSSMISLRSADGLSFKAKLRPPGRAIYKPPLVDNKRAALNEVAAFRVASMLGIEGVPVASLRTERASALRKRFKPRSRWRRHQALIEIDAGSVHGALIDDIATVPLTATLDEIALWVEEGQSVPEDRHTLARSYSNMVVFDFLIGNNTRMKISGDATGKALMLIDHDEAFAVDENSQSLSFKRLLRVKKFSRSVIERLAVLDRKALAFNAEKDSLLLSPADIDAILERKTTLLSYVASLCEGMGTRNVLFFE